jgi:hypothetical protein
MSFRLLPLWSRMTMIIMIPYVSFWYNRNARLTSSLIRRIVFHWRRGDILGNHLILVIPVRCGMMGKHRFIIFAWGVDAGLLIHSWCCASWGIGRRCIPRLVITLMDALHTNRPTLHPVCFVQRSNIWLCFEALHTNRKTPHWLLYHLSLLSELVL